MPFVTPDFANQIFVNDNPTIHEMKNVASEANAADGQILPGMILEIAKNGPSNAQEVGVRRATTAAQARRAIALPWIPRGGDVTTAYPGSTGTTAALWKPVPVKFAYAKPGAEVWVRFAGTSLSAGQLLTTATPGTTAGQKLQGGLVTTTTFSEAAFEVIMDLETAQTNGYDFGLVKAICL